jgi:hypothetical protein
MEGIRPHERLHFVVSELSTCTVHLNAQNGSNTTLSASLYISSVAAKKYVQP